MPESGYERQAFRAVCSTRDFAEMTDILVRNMRAAAVAIALELACQGCVPRETPGGAAAVPAVNWEAEAARLIRTLDLPSHLQESARDYAAKQTARGIAPEPALEQWIQAQRDRGAVIRCKPEVSATAECIART
jgi:hypothetical protein